MDSRAARQKNGIAPTGPRRHLARAALEYAMAGLLILGAGLTAAAVLIVLPAILLISLVAGLFTPSSEIAAPSRRRGASHHRPRGWVPHLRTPPSR